MSLFLDFAKLTADQVATFPPELLGKQILGFLKHLEHAGNSQDAAEHFSRNDFVVTNFRNHLKATHKGAEQSALEAWDWLQRELYIAKNLDNDSVFITRRGEALA